MLRRLAAHCYKHRWRVLISWVVLLVGVNVLAQTVGGDLLKTFSLPGSQSQAAFDVLKRDFARKGDTGDLVFKVRGAGDVNSPKVVAAINPVIAELAKQPHVVSVSSPYLPANARFISSGGKIAYAEILFDVQANDVPINLATHMRSIVSKANTPDLQIDLAGSMFTDQTQPASEAIGVAAAILILLLAFGSLLA
ncbi:MAG: putative drug exporter of the superfamily, partial [Actinomycetota bacterium]|nr:putative drug exporter of the superfamily [Actinomycetota bacterium]